jgi:hypothetical protein
MSAPENSDSSTRADEIRAALISAVCHAHRGVRHADAPPVLNPMPLDQLVEVLQRDETDLTHFVRVLAACWLLDNPSRAERLDPYATALLGPTRGQLIFPDGLRGSISFVQPPIIESGTIPRTRFAHALNTLLGSSECAPANHLLGVWLDPATLVTTIEASVDVNATQRPPGRFRTHADPRGWQDNAGLFFKKSERCDLIDSVFQAYPNPPKIGDTDYGGLLLEHVSLGFAPGLAIDCVNVLKVKCESQNPRPSFEVSLHACLEANLASSYSRGGLDVDSGIFVAMPVDGMTRVRGTKLARFTERAWFTQPIGRQLNYFAPFCLAALMSTLIFGGACYDPT